MRIELDIAAIEEAARADIEAVAQAIADDANANTTLSVLKKPRWQYTVRVIDGQVVVGSDHGLAPNDEYGAGRNALSTPSGALRSAGAKRGRFQPS